MNEMGPIATSFAWAVAAGMIILKFKTATMYTLIIMNGSFPGFLIVAAVVNLC